MQSVGAIWYAKENEASSAVVNIIGDYEVHVVARTAAQMFFAGIVGIDSVDVSAKAVAKCGCAASVCGAFPMAFDEETWNDIPCWEEFYVWQDQRIDDPDIMDKCVCTDSELALPFSVASVGSGHRGWLRLDEPPPGEYENPGGCGGDCGNNSLKCWIHHDFDGPLGVGVCVPGEPGVIDSATKAVKDRIGDIVDIVIWNNEEGCTSEFGDCPGTLYRIAGFGRVVVKDVLTLDLECQEGDEDCSPSDCPENVKMIKAYKMCPDDDVFQACSGLSDSEHPCPGGYTAVALIR